MYFKDKLSFIQELNPEIQEKILSIYNLIFILIMGDDEKSDTKLSQELGELAFLITQPGVNYESRINICINLFSIFERGNEIISLKLKNFFEIICTLDDYILNWIINIQKSERVKNFGKIQLITEIIISSRIKKGDIEICEREIEFYPENYNGYKELATYFLFSKDYIKSLYYINKALRCCPGNLKGYFEMKRKEIIYRMEE